MLRCNLLRRLVTAQRLKRHRIFDTCLKNCVSSSFVYPVFKAGYILARCPVLPDHFSYLPHLIESDFDS